MAMFGMMQLLMVAMMGGAGNDLLDYMQTKAYWQIKGVAVTAEAMQAELKPVLPGQVKALMADLTGNDEAKRKAAAGRLSTMGVGVIPQLTKAAATAQGNPEKAGAIQQLIGKLYQARQAGSVRRLMAIRTLGELKARAAMPMLTGLLKSKALFEADYAAAAIAAIGGKPYKRPGVSAKTLAADVWRLPSNCGIVAQSKMPPGGPVDFAKILKKVGSLPGGMKAEQILVQATQMLVKAAEMTGNIRFDGATMGVAGNAADRTGFVAIIVRGTYDAKALAALMGEQGRIKTETVNGIEVLKPDNEVALILPGNDMLVFCAGPNREQLPLGEMTTAIKTGVGGLKPASDLGKLIKTLDTSGPLWAAATITDAYRKGGPIIASFKTMTLVSKTVKDGQTFTVTGKGADPKQVDMAVKAFNGLIAMGGAELEQQVQRGRPQSEMLKPILEFFKSIKATADGASATATGTIKGSSLTTIAPLLLWTVSVRDHGPPKMEDIPPDRAVPDGPAERAETPAPAPADRNRN